MKHEHVPFPLDRDPTPAEATAINAAIAKGLESLDAGQGERVTDITAFVKSIGDQARKDFPSCYAPARDC